MFVALVVVLFYFLPYFVGRNSISENMIIPDWGLVIAGLNFTIAFILYLFAPKDNRAFFAALIVYLLMISTSCALIIATGGIHSSFISLWIVTTVFASVFGYWAITPIALALVGYGAYMHFVVAPLTLSELITFVAAGLTPLIASYVIFHSRFRKQSAGDPSYHQLADELSQTSSKADVVLRAIDDGVIALNKQGNIELINPAAQQFIGWGDKDAVGLNYASVLKLVDGKHQALTSANDPVAAVLRTNQDIRTKDFSAVTSSGKYISLSLGVLPIGQGSDGVIVVFRDITRELAEGREQAEFISTASHEMRTPVASIEGYLGLALNPSTATIDEKAKSYLEKAHASAQHLGRLFQDLLDVSKADDGRLANHPGVINVIDFVGEIAEGFRQSAEQKGLRFIYTPSPDSVGSQDPSRVIAPVFYVNVDGDHLREATSNLIENAIKYTAEGEVMVDVTGDNTHVVISVKDSGIGIAREDIPHLFQKFYRVDNSKTREIGGTGLGLYLCRRLSEVMGGRLWVDSEFGKGSTFHLELPRLSKEEALPMIAAAKAAEAAEASGASTQQPTQTIASSSAPATPVPVQPTTAPTPAPQPQQSQPFTPQLAQPAQAAAIPLAPTFKSVPVSTPVDNRSTSLAIPVRQNMKNS